MYDDLYYENSPNQELYRAFDKFFGISELGCVDNRNSYEYIGDYFFYSEDVKFLDIDLRYYTNSSGSKEYKGLFFVADLKCKSDLLIVIESRIDDINYYGDNQKDLQFNKCFKLKTDTPDASSYLNEDLKNKVVELGKMVELFNDGMIQGYLPLSITISRNKIYLSLKDVNIFKLNYKQSAPDQIDDSIELIESVLNLITDIKHSLACYTLN